MFIDDLDSAKLGDSGVLLYSGGTDSTLLAHALIRRGKRLIGLSIDYPGRPAAEIAIAGRIAGRLGLAEHLTIGLDLPWHPLRGETGGLNEGWFPHRNLMFLGLALHVAEIRGAHSSPPAMRGPTASSSAMRHQDSSSSSIRSPPCRAAADRPTARSTLSCRSSKRTRSTATKPSGFRSCRR